MLFSTLATWLVCSLATTVYAQDTSLATVVAAFNKANIPRDLDITFQPNVLLEVTFPQPNGHQNVTVNAGENVPRDETVNPPRFAIRGGNFGPTQEFVIAVVDPDAPTPAHPTDAQIRLFLGGNFVEGRTLRHNNAVALRENTPPITPWHQPSPPAGSPPHRVVFLIFEQPANFNKQNVVTPQTPRAHFDISAFAKEVNLGNPIGGTFILVGPDGNSN